MSVLRDILEKGYVDPEILDALDEEQKQMLFIQMRQEQIRKFLAYEDQLERDGPKPRKQKKKGVRWKAGADGDVWVWVMGDHPDDKSIEEILEEEARREAHFRALQEIERETSETTNEEAALKAQLNSLRNSVYEDSDASWDEQLNSKPPFLQRQPASSNFNGLSPTRNWENGRIGVFTTSSEPPLLLTNGNEPSSSNGAASPQKAVVTTFSTPTPQVAPLPVNENFSAAGDIINGVKMRAPKALTPEEASEEVNKRESEIFQNIQEKREQLKREAEAEAERERLAWEEQERKAREAEAAIRSIAQKARDQHRKLLRTSTSILPALSDTKAASLREAIKNLPRPARPKNRAEIVSWFKKNELSRGTGLDPKTGLPAVWFHGIISRDSAEQLLTSKPSGSFLVRVSERIWGYTVSYLVSGTTCKHFLIERIEQGYQFLGTNQIVHESLFDLITYHESAPITAKGGEILKWSVGQIMRPPDYSDLLPDSANNNRNSSSKTPGRF